MSSDNIAYLTAWATALVAMCASATRGHMKSGRERGTRARMVRSSPRCEETSAPESWPQRFQSTPEGVTSRLLR
eukprot:2432886-Prymnesium_polylepis.2